MIQPTAQDQYMLELLNQARENPQAAANLLLEGDLNAGLQPDTLSTEAKPPLAWNLSLVQAAQTHSQWMLDSDTFSHTGEGGSRSWERASAAGYNWKQIGENIAWRGSTGMIDFTATVKANQEALFRSPGHRTNILNNSYREIGISNLTGTFNGYNAVMTTQLFGSDANPNAFLTGVVYTDQIKDDNFYTVGEGLGNVTVLAVKDGQTYRTSTLDAGGYQIRLDPGTYSVTFEGDFDGDGQQDRTSAKSIAIGSQNVKLDLATDDLVNKPVNNQPDSASDTTSTAVETPVENSSDNNQPAKDNVSPPPQPTLMGTTAADILTGSDDADIIWGLGDNDRLQGQAGDDTLVGGTGNDFLLGGAGNDRIIGVDGSADNAGAYERDFLRGDAGQDWFVLGDADQAFYVEADGLEGAAILLDFDRMADTIELHGSADRYRLEQSSGYTRILYGSTGTPTELIAIVLRDFANLDLNAEYFSYA